MAYEIQNKTLIFTNSTKSLRYLFTFSKYQHDLREVETKERDNLGTLSPQITDSKCHWQEKEEENGLYLIKSKLNLQFSN